MEINAIVGANRKRKHLSQNKAHVEVTSSDSSELDTSDMSSDDDDNVDTVTGPSGCKAERIDLEMALDTDVAVVDKECATVVDKSVAVIPAVTEPALKICRAPCKPSVNIPVNRTKTVKVCLNIVNDIITRAQRNVYRNIPYLETFFF